MVLPAVLSDVVPAAIRGTVRRAIDIVLPPRCLGCGELVGDPGAVCPACWGGIDFIVPPMCRCCGLSLDYDEGDQAVCGDYARRDPLFDRARSVMIYNDSSRRLVLAFKHADRIDAEPAWGGWLWRVPGPPCWPTRICWCRVRFTVVADYQALQSGGADGAGNGPEFGAACRRRRAAACPRHAEPGPDEPISARTQCGGGIFRAQQPTGEHPARGLSW